MEGPRPGSTADVSKRVERLEQSHATLSDQVHGLTLDVQRAILSVEHLQELLDPRFTAMEKSVEAVGTKVDSLSVFVQNIAADPIATPAGRQVAREAGDIEGRLDHVDSTLRTHETQLGYIRLAAKAMALALGSGGALALILTIIQLVERMVS